MSSSEVHAGIKRTTAGVSSMQILRRQTEKRWKNSLSMKSNTDGHVSVAFDDFSSYPP